MNEIDQLEQELAALRRRFAQSLEIVEDLSQVKLQFTELSKMHQALQATLEQAKALLEHPHEQAMEPRLTQLESQTDMRYEQLQAQLTNFRFDFDAITRQLQEQLERGQDQLVNLKQGSDHQQLNQDDVERVKWLESSLQHLNSTLYADRSTLQKLDRRYSSLKRTVDIIAVAGFVSIVLMGLLIFMFRL